MDNSKVLHKGLKRAKQMMYSYLLSEIENACEELIYKALNINREFQGFTGNTQTSYACGIYFNGKLVEMIIAGDTMRKPIRLKVEHKEVAYLPDPYEGKPRPVEGKVKVDSFYGAKTSADFLASYKPFINKGFSVVMTTGTEYSEYLENVLNLDVLTDTYKSAKGIVLETLKPMKV